MTLRSHRLLAWLWLALVLALAAHQGWLWTRAAGVLDSDVLAMLPRDERRPVVAEATRALADAGERRVVVLIGAKDAAVARRAGDRFAELVGDAATLRWRVDEAEQGAWLDFYSPRRAGLLTDAQRAQLRQSPIEPLAQQAVQALHQPVGMPRVGAWNQDPLNLFGGWLAERAQISRVRVDQGRLMLSDGDTQYAVLMLDAQGSAFAVAQQRALVDRLDAATEAVRQAEPDARVLRGGVPLFAAAAAAQAEREIHTIGAGSLIGIVLLTWCAFRSIRPRLLVTLSMAVGLAAAISATQLVFGSLHLITLVFGATLLGVAENYGSNYFCARMGLAHEDRWDMLRRQWPIVSLAMLTTVLAYALVGLAPFPGLRQIALFSAVGLLAAFLTVMLWFPWLDGRSAVPTRFALWLGGLRARWPAPRGRAAWVLAAALLVVLVTGGLRLRGNDDIRQLQSAPPALIADQREISRLLDLPGVAQFLLVRADDAQALLRREEALRERLAALGVPDTQLQAVSQWLPSIERQRADAALRERRDGDLLRAVATLLDDEIEPAPRAAFEPLMPDTWSASPVAEPLRHQWLGRGADGHWTSAVLLRAGERGLPADRLRALDEDAGGLPGVIVVDKVGEISALMGRYRVLIGALVLAGHALVWAALWPRFGRRAWRAVAPTTLASALTLAALGLLGVPLQLFHMLPLLILLGLGVDYGIFLLEQPARDEVKPFLSISLAALSTLLAFGLLALSGTPALRAFGLTLLIGVTLAWWLTPVFMPSSAPRAHGGASVDLQEQPGRSGTSGTP